MPSANKVVGRKYSHTLYHKVRNAVIAKLGGKCANPACQWLNSDGSRGCTDHRCLQVDHVNSNGAEERKKFGHNSSKIYRRILAGCIEGYQLLCANCNWIKKAVNNENPQLPH